MQLGTAPLLERHRVFHSHVRRRRARFWAARATSSIFRRARAATQHAHQRLLHARHVPRLYALRRLASRAFSRRGAHRLSAPAALRGHLKRVWTRARQQPFSSCHRVAGAQAIPVRVERGQRPPALALGQAALSGQLAALLGEPPTAPLDFAPAMDLTTGYGRSLAQHVLMAVASLEEAGSVLLIPSR